MSTIRFRPTFQLDTPYASSETKRRIEATLEMNADEFHTQFKERHAMISIAEAKRHFWSPWLHLEVRESESGSLVAGRFSPHPSIWTGFMFAYLSLGVLIFFSAIFGFSQQMANQSPYAYYAIPVWIFIAIALWLASQTGQKLALDEMKLLKGTIEHSLED